ncbi:hypothetical protein IV203_030535 [Nitzschia inconspicua]|uniref:Uncharacterized protein n=1 Tax=Nitzschia inconspicua TaxID=303405 RepID=A0A9K3LTD4_9STRA|nr:hypothetical protein IV203_030535 [Nitzschia inconspicua]
MTSTNCNKKTAIPSVRLWFTHRLFGKTVGGSSSSSRNNPKSSSPSPSSLSSSSSVVKKTSDRKSVRSAARTASLDSSVSTILSATSTTSTSTTPLSSSSSSLSSENVRIVTRWIETWAAKDTQKVVSISHPECEYHVPMEDDDDMVITLKDFIDQMELCYKSFPDYTSTWGSIDDYGCADNDDGRHRVIIKGFVGRGTHTGTAFAFGPFPSIEATGTRIKDGPIDLIVILKDGMPHTINTRLNGNSIGPISQYTQIGGVVW